MDHYSLYDTIENGERYITIIRSDKKGIKGYKVFRIAEEVTEVPKMTGENTMQLFH